MASAEASASDYLWAARTWVPVYDRQFTDTKTSHTIEVANLTTIPGYAPADSYLFVFRWDAGQQGWVMAGADDDGGVGRGSKLVNVYTGYTYRVLVVGYRSETPGYADLKVDNVVAESSILFGGARVGWWPYPTAMNWSSGQTFSVVADGGAGQQPITDSMLWIFRRSVGSRLNEDDDNGFNLQAHRSVPGTCSSDCEVILGPYSLWSGGDALVVKNGVVTDSDGDGLVNALEAEVGSVPLLVDSDGDTIGDYAELFGVPDPNGTAGYDHSLELHAMGAHPNAKDLFIQMDYNHLYRSPHPDQASWLAATFTNDSGYSGKTIYVHWDQLDQLPSAVRYVDFSECQYLGSPPNPAYATVDQEKAVYFDPLREGVFTYGVTSERGYIYNQQGGGGCQVTEPLNDRGKSNASSILVHYVDASQPAATRGVVVHEHGHTTISMQELDFGYPRPRSSMNYSYKNTGFVVNGVTRWSYSNGTYAPLCPSGTCTEAYAGSDCDCNEWSFWHF